jgi:hypothetical protein
VLIADVSEADVSEADVSEHGESLKSRKSNNPYDTHVPVFFDAVGWHRVRGRCTAACRTVSALLAVSVGNVCV